MSDFSACAARRKSRCCVSLEARWPPSPTGSREPWRSGRSSHLMATDSLTLMTTRPAAHLGPLNRVGHLVAREEVFFQSVTPILRKNRLIIEVSALTPRSADRQSQRA